VAGESVKATENEIVRRVAVSSIAWLDGFSTKLILELFVSASYCRAEVLQRVLQRWKNHLIEISEECNERISIVFRFVREKIVGNEPSFTCTSQRPEHIGVTSVPLALRVVGTSELVSTADNQANLELATSKKRRGEGKVPNRFIAPSKLEPMRRK
jgi:hypothetical protein